MRHLRNQFATLHYNVCFPWKKSWLLMRISLIFIMFTSLLLDRNFPTSELMPLPSTIDLEITVPAPDRKITLHAIAARESTTEVAVFDKCKNKRS